MTRAEETSAAEDIGGMAEAEQSTPPRATQGLSQRCRCPSPSDLPPRPTQQEGPSAAHMSATEFAAAAEQRGGRCALWKLVEEILSRWPGYAGRKKFEQEYRTTRLLGRGSFGVVHRVIETATRRRCVAKTLERPGFERTAENYDRWRQVLTEIEVMGVLNHPNCLRLLDVYAGTGKLYIITEYTENAVNLDRFAAENSLGERDTSEIAYHCLRALHYLHESKRIVHRDIKPANILIARREPLPQRQAQRARPLPLGGGEAAKTAVSAAAAGAVAVAVLARLVSRCRSCKGLCIGPAPCCGSCGRISRQKEIHQGLWSSNTDHGKVVHQAIERGVDIHEQQCNLFTVKLIDFGCARYVGSPAQAAAAAPAAVTPVGSSLYLSLETIDNVLRQQGESPEQSDSSSERAVELLPRIDIFSLGVVSYILLCRVHPFRATPVDDAQTMRGKMLRGLDFPAEAWGVPLKNPLSDAAKDFLTHMLDLDPANRPSAASALRHVWILGRASLPCTANDIIIRPCCCPRDLIFKAPEEVGDVCVGDAPTPAAAAAKPPRSPSPPPETGVVASEGATSPHKRFRAG
eukprot:TRINITY_DN6823_c0_g1_i1.p1 TRINITY_DN6823_c0_g1~~TRINITY_DN6823_c0_g1_i1.p1  ORF type:complete len:606 (+),score=122.90 TRINITY_DN6823_c0_g1_i1:91-1818(+)